MQVGAQDDATLRNCRMGVCCDDVERECNINDCTRNEPIMTVNCDIAAAASHCRLKRLQRMRAAMAYLLKSKVFVPYEQTAARAVQNTEVGIMHCMRLDCLYISNTPKFVAGTILQWLIISIRS